MRPHVFVTRGDLTHIACSAWMVPTDKSLSVRRHWRRGNPDLEKAITGFHDEDFLAGRTHASAPSAWFSKSPLPVFTAVPFNGFDDAGEFEPIIDEFAAVAKKTIENNLSYLAEVRPDGWDQVLQRKRPLPLLAMPVLGAGGGGGAEVMGDLIRTILRATSATAERHNVDIVLVLRDAAQLALAQRIRRTEMAESWSQLTDELKETAADLAKDAVAGKIVPFMGAGVSMSAGAPSWDGLVGALAEGAGLSFSERAKLEKKNVLDQAEILLSLYGDASRFNKAVAALVEVDRYGLAPTLLASLPLEQAITLNYDTLFERASEDAGAPCAVIPSGDDGRSDDDATRWLLKMHGTVTDHESIVLTREDYLGFDANRNVLAALVKASLVTKRLVFVGFGLGDDHFHQIVHDVRAVEPGKISRNAVALTLVRDSLDERAWDGKLKLCPMTPEDTDPNAAGRVLEIFLDYLLALSTDSREYLLDEAFESQLTEDEKVIKGGLLALRASLVLVRGSDGTRQALRNGLNPFGLDELESDNTYGYDERVEAWQNSALFNENQLGSLVSELSAALSIGPHVIDDYEQRQWEAEESNAPESERAEIASVLEQVQIDIDSAERGFESLLATAKELRDHYEQFRSDIEDLPFPEPDVPEPWDM